MMYCFMTSSDPDRVFCWSWLCLDRDVFVWPRVSKPRDQPEPGLADAGTVAVDEGQLPDRRVHRPLVYDLLHLVQDRLAALRIQFGRLLREQLVEIGVVAVGISAALDRQDLEAGGRIAKRATAALDQ